MDTVVLFCIIKSNLCLLISLLLKFKTLLHLNCFKLILDFCINCLKSLKNYLKTIFPNYQYY